MATVAPNARHPALGIDESERVDYLIAVASMAATDHVISAKELACLEAMCDGLKIATDGKARVLEAAHAPDQVALDSILDSLRTSDLRYALLVDAIAVAEADRDVGQHESDELFALAQKLDIPPAQAVLVRRYVDTWRQHGRGPTDARTAAKLVGAGIPVAALAVTAAAGAPFAAGVGLAAALGVSSYMSVRWLFRHARGGQQQNGRPRRKRRWTRRSAAKAEAPTDHHDHHDHHP
ncbi:MAG: hypothetical protein AAGC55_03495 [Myxococcota bacterium]